MTTLAYVILGIFLIWLYALIWLLSSHTPGFINLDPFSFISSDDNSSTIAYDGDVITKRHVNISWPKVANLQSDYPNFNSLLDIIKRWNPDNPDPPDNFRETLVHFNFSNPKERSIAEEYRNSELPFKLYDVKDISAVVDLWTDNYLVKKMKHVHAHVEESESNHFMYWNIRERFGKPYTPPTSLIEMNFKDWLKIANDADETRMTSSKKHYYFMLGTTSKDGSNMINKDLPMFSTRNNNFFITNVRANKGIQCRFGMRGVISEAHYDSGRNMVAMIKGAKRYILTPPSSCKKLSIISEQRHPSYRHSVIDWSDVNQATSRGFDSVQAIDTIVRTGEVLYIPSYWFHYIISLQYSVQCNSRSGSPPDKNGESDINECMRRDQRTKKKNGKRLV